MMVRIDLRRQELLRRILQTRKNSSVQIHKDNNLKLTALGYTVSTKGLLTVPEGVVLRHLPACLAHTPPLLLPCASPALPVPCAEPASPLAPHAAPARVSVVPNDMCRTRLCAGAGHPWHLLSH